MCISVKGAWIGRVFGLFDSSELHAQKQTYESNSQAVCHGWGGRCLGDKFVMFVGERVVSYRL